MVGRVGTRQLAVALSVLLLALVGAPTRAEPVARVPAGPGSAPELDPSAPVGELVGELRALTGAFDGSPHAGLAALVVHDEPIVRLALARLLAQRPELEPSGALARLAADADEAVAAAGLLGLARSRDATSPAALEAALASPLALRRELAAVALTVRAALAPAEGLPPVEPALVERARPQIVSEQGRRWLDTVAEYGHLRAAEDAWLMGHRALLALERDPEGGACAQRVRANPSVLVPPGTDPESARLSERIEWPAHAAAVPGEAAAVVLLASGQHDALADQRYGLEDRQRALTRFVARLETYCAGASALALPPVRLDPVSGEGAPPGVRTAGGFVGIGLGVVNNPFAYREGGSDFLIGEDIELTLVPELRFGVTRARALAPGSATAGRPGIVDGWALATRVGGLLSTAFFEDRSRPEGTLVFVHDQPVAPTTVDGRARNRRLAAWTELSAGFGQVSRDLTRFPAPHLEAGLAFERVTSEGSLPDQHRDAAVHAEVELVNYVFDDANAPPRDRRWLEGRVGGHWLAGRDQEVRVGLRGGAGVRSNSQLDGLTALTVEAAPALRWHEGDVRVDLWAGAGLGWLPSAPDAFDDTPFVDAIGGFQAQFDSDQDAFALNFGVQLVRTVDRLGRNGYVGLRERAEADVRLSLAGAMRDAIGLTLFAERAHPEDGGTGIGFGGLELFIPVGLIEVDQEITYQMRYLAMFDENRFGTRSQDVFEAVLSAGARF